MMIPQMLCVGCCWFFFWGGGIWIKGGAEESGILDQMPACRVAFSNLDIMEEALLKSPETVKC